MNESVRFVMINLKNSESDFDFEGYTNSLLEQAKINLKASDLKIHSNDARTSECSIAINSNTFDISFTYVKLNATSQLKVDISGEDYTHLDPNLHHLKTQLKDLMLADWEQCLWLQDIQAEKYSDSLYKDVHTVENALRRLINTILFYKLGGKWWEKYMPTNLVERYTDRDEQYKNRAVSFKNTHTGLMSIDTADLIQILSFKTYKVKELNLFSSPNTNEPDIQKFQYIMSDILSGQKIDRHKDNLTKILQDLLEVDRDFWKDFFAPWFSCDLREFKGKWTAFCNDRNHVAHNKLIDIKLFQKYKKLMKELLELIEEADKKFNNHLHSEMDQYLADLEAQAELDNMQILRESELEFHQNRKIREEAGVEILEKDEIMELFREKVSASFDNIYEKLYYRSDIELDFKEPQLVNSETAFEITHTYLDHIIRVDIEPSIDSSQAGVSTLLLTLYKDDIKENTFTITFTNGSAYFDDDQGAYLPINIDEVEISELEELETDIYTYVEHDMPEVDEDEIASFPCEQCNKYTINLSEDNEFDIGTCLSCKHPNHVGRCIMCRKIVDSPKDNLVCSDCKTWLK
ncbi:hypothetical protein BW425_24060 [Bacillus pseudomycoides]|uniref:Apea-like HEPN domain-containing protein n=1 Tax=Bacillus pseudomycoides TaxID=64104 RepID=A0A1Y3M8C2_9BACI|nr:hypothetical protein [Bacillus pseudomycoides]OUM46356.1 hypothetical protein BW425_24060 [Bacillus pseudomycoides]